MNIQKVSYTSNSKSSQSFKGLHVTNPKVQKLLLKSLDNKQIETLSNIVRNQENNSVHILLDSKNGQTLNASFFCPYRIKNFKFASNLREVRLGIPAQQKLSQQYIPLTRKFLSFFYPC